MEGATTIEGKNIQNHVLNTLTPYSATRHYFFYIVNGYNTCNITITIQMYNPINDEVMLNLHHFGTFSTHIQKEIMGHN